MTTRSTGKEGLAAESELRAEPSSSDAGSTCLERSRPPWPQSACGSEYVGSSSRKSWAIGHCILSTIHQGVSIYRPIIYGNTAVVLAQKEREALPTPDHTHRWTVAVRSAASAPDSDIVGGADDLSYFIKRVTFKLHDTYANPNRSESVTRRVTLKP